MPTSIFTWPKNAKTTGSSPTNASSAMRWRWKWMASPWTKERRWHSANWWNKILQKRLFKKSVNATPCRGTISSLLLDFSDVLKYRRKRVFPNSLEPIREESFSFSFIFHREICFVPMEITYTHQILETKWRRRRDVLFVYALYVVFSLNVSSLSWNSSVVPVPMAIDVVVNLTYADRAIANDLDTDLHWDFDP